MEGLLQSINYRINIRKMNSLWVLIIFFLFPTILIAQEDLKTPQFSHISVGEGLSQSTVFCISQDNKSFMWFGTRSGGLNRYDGCEFKVFKHDPNDSTTISNNEVISILEDNEGKLWVGTRKGGLNRFNKTTERFQRYPTDHAVNGTEGNTINDLFEDSKNRIWVASNAGLDVIINGKITKNLIPQLNNKHLTSVSEDSCGILYITDKKGLYRYDETTLHLAYYPYQKNRTSTLSSNYSCPVYVDSKQRVWLGSTRGVMLFKDDSIQNPFLELSGRFQVPEAETRSIHEDQLGNIWIGTIKGLFCYHPEDKSIALYTRNDYNNQSLSHNSIYSIFEDKSGLLWIGTWGGGVNVLSYKLFKFNHYKHQKSNPKSLSNNSVSSFAEDKDGIWIGTESGGLNFLPHHSNEFETISTSELSSPTLNSNHIKALLKSKSNYLYIGSYNGGLSRLNTQTRQISHLITNVKAFALAESPNGIIWIGTLNGLYQYNENTGKTKHYEHDPNNPYSLAHNFTNTLFVSSNGTLWIGTKEAGLMKYVAGSDHFISYKNDPQDSTSILSNYIITLEEDLNGNLLVGTSNGINIFNSLKQNFEQLVLEDMPDKNINGIISDENNNYWIATNKGLTKYSHTSAAINYDINDGLQSNEFNRNASYRDSKHNIYFGGINGYNVFHPDQVIVNTEIPDIIITQFKISNQEITPESKDTPLEKHISETEKIILKHDQNDVSFEFVALNYIVPQKNQYAYKLEGYNDTWIYCGSSRVANYTNLKPGHYSFIVKGSNNDNIWNEVGTSIEIHIQQPFWKTPIAYFLYLLIITILLFSLKWLITMRIEQQNLLRMERLEKKQIEDLNQIKLRFFTNVAHEFRTPLSLIAGPLEEINNQHSQTKEQAFLLGIVQNNVKRLLLLVDELLDFRKAGNQKVQLRVTESSLVDFINHILKCFSESVQKKNISLKFTHPIDNSMTSYFDHGVLDKIIFNLLSNALKYTPPNGKIKVTLEVDQQQAVIKVIDSGKGIAEKDLDKIFDRFYQGKNSLGNINGSGIGLAYAKRLTEAHRGNISVSSIIDHGTTFTISIPIDRESYLAEIEENDHIAYIDNTHTTPEEFEELDLPEVISEESSPYHILIVEDNKELNAFLKYFFKSYKVDTAYNGKEGFEKASKNIPDLIISDIMMPEMNGLELCKKLKTQFLTSHIPVVLLTAKSEKSHKIEGIQHGADAYIEKPFDSKLLEATVQNILLQRKKLKVRLGGEDDESQQTENLNPHDQRFTEIVNKTIKENLHISDFTVESLAEMLNMSRSQLFRKFKALYDYSPSETLRAERLNYAKRLISEKRYNINEVSDLAGFSSSSYFITCFKKYYGLTPADYLKKL